jgi:redox-sensitive bicupin YhaK (pirin superfamily)
MADVTVVPQSQLFVSEPDPRMFGNSSNPRDGTAFGWSNANWLKSRFHFSFAEWRGGPSNFGCLRVMNDDLVQPERGFGTHPHRDMEIMTFIVDGNLTHKDSMGTQETLGRGSFQFMTAGSGIQHSEHNLAKTPLRFIQSWVVPRSRGLKPNYGSFDAGENAAQARRNQWAHLVSDVQASADTPVKIHQDCNVYVSELTAESQLPPMALSNDRQAYMLCVEGSVTTTGEKSLERHEAAMVKGPLDFEVKAGGNGALLLMFEMAKS